jgi:hypothetical protein
MVRAVPEIQGDEMKIYNDEQKDLAMSENL